MTVLTVRTAFRYLALLLLIVVSSTSVPADEPIRGLVVDRNSKTLYIGLPVCVPTGTVFDVSLVPGDVVIARATVTTCTPDAPYVAQAAFKLVEPDGFIPVGAYVEVVDGAVPETDRPDGFKSVELGPYRRNPLSLSVGAFFPLDNDLETETGGIWPEFRLAYQTSRTQTFSTSIGIGYAHKYGTFAEMGVSGERDFRVYPVTFDARFYPARQIDRGGWFGRLGVGAYTIRDRRVFAGVSDTDTTTEFGWLAGFGYESSGGRTAQVYYEDTSGTEFRGLVLAVGARF